VRTGGVSIGTFVFEFNKSLNQIYYQVGTVMKKMRCCFGTLLVCLTPLMTGLEACIATEPAPRIQYRQDAGGVHVEGFTGRNPVLYDNDWWNDTTDGFYLWAKASQGKADLRGNVVSRDMYDWRKGYSFTMKQGMESASKAVQMARQSGLAKVPDPVAGCDKVFEKPASERIEDTKIIESPGSRLIVKEALLATPDNPLVVFVGGPINTVANAVLMEPKVAERMIVCMTDLQGYNGMDQWANYIVAKRCRLLNYGAKVWWPQRSLPPVMPLDRFAAIPQNDMTREMHRIAKHFWDRSTKKDQPIRDDGFGDGAPIFLYFTAATWTRVQPRRVTGMFQVQDVPVGEPFDLIDGRDCDYALMTEDFFRTFTQKP
jgi:hypothetical protein